MSRDSAVSPVVGVMLLLALVIVFTAVFAAFAGGLAQTPAPAPSVEIAAYSAGSGENFSLIFDHRSGDVLSAENCKITAFVDAHESSFPVSALAPGSWRPGELLTTNNLTATAAYLQLPADKLTGYLAHSTPLELRIYYLPTNSIIFKDTIILEENR